MTLHEPDRPTLVEADVDRLERCVDGGGIALFPSDTVYGLAADAESEPAVARLYAIKRRPPMPSAVMFFSLERALDALPRLGARTEAAFQRLLPGPVTLIVSNPEGRYPLAAGKAGGGLGVRVPRLEGPLAALRGLRRPVLQSSANLHGGPDPRRLEDVPEQIRTKADLVLDGGELPGVASTVVDLSDFESGRFELLREGALSLTEVERLLSGIG